MRNNISKISVLIPAYNEEAHIALCIEETVNAFLEFGYQFEIIVIDDGSVDDTYKKAIEKSGYYKNVFVKRNIVNFGKGRALKKGFRYTTGDYIVFLDADLDLHPSQVKIFIDYMLQNNNDVIIGSKRHPESEIEYPPHRMIVSLVYFILVKLLFGLSIHDTQTGLKFFKREVLKKVFPKVLVKKFAYDLELLVLANHYGYKIAEAPVKLGFQRMLGSRIGFNAIWSTWWDTMAVFYRLYILRYYDKVQ
ncbi:MAG: glycosyltransferase family 2 protein [Candidatus Omnitrophica bacterium CG07_land_8_20_14_0_80_42_15]|uniref:Glycosyltransferase family 2 protein n=1 Tax=Candidatus Aquitaenariimonas noxiae TaxID=1974741 RepID=A0A2J0KR75_9BACT|nr:MAG: glycosyltransferase family 2 protein [Candidatus Omnitrophica bacterium CG07_land_8_20_14_0_80_42_15]